MMTGMYETIAWGRAAKGAKFEKMAIQRNLPGDDDVTFDVKFCGICHSDVHLANNDLATGEGSGTKYPIVPGHELAGIVTAVGKNVNKFKVGDRVGVGCIVDSCMDCEYCHKQDEHCCAKGMSMTYDSETKHGHIKTNSGYTFGGYCMSQTVHNRYLIKIPDGYLLEESGPIFCAAITMYSPLVHWEALNGGKKVGIVGIGGLGQMGLAIAKAMGNEVTAISTSASKEAAAKQMGADKFIVSTDPESMKAGAASLDLILNTVSAPHQLATYLPLLRRDGSLVQLGLVPTQHHISQLPLLFMRQKISGSCIGGIKETQDCMDFCDKHKIRPKVTLIKADELDQVYTSLEEKNDQVVRYVLDTGASTS